VERASTAMNERRLGRTEPRTREQVEALRREISAIPAWYHAIDLGDDIVTPGPFDVGKNLAEYPLPADLTGQRVLDVGCGNGLFPCEFGRRGAREVVALDLPSWVAHDWSPRKLREYERRSPEQIEELGPPLMRRPFELVGRELGSTRVRREEMTIYDVR